MNAAVTIYHNPDCGTSRNTLALIRASGIEPTVIEYLRQPPDEATLRALIARAGMRARDLMRVKGTPCKALGLDDPSVGDEQIIAQMLQHPILINRPLVVTQKGVRLCRPSDIVLDVLPVRAPADARKEDGTPFLVDREVSGQDPGLREALGAAALPVDDLDEPGRRFYAFDSLAGERLGHGGFELYGRDLLLRSMVVAPAARGRGIGAAVLALLLRRAFDQGARQAWLLTTDAAGFFQRQGFTRVERSAAPAAILATRQASTLCAASAALMTRAITP